MGGRAPNKQKKVRPQGNAVVDDQNWSKIPHPKKTQFSPPLEMEMKCAKWLEQVLAMYVLRESFP